MANGYWGNMLEINLTSGSINKTQNRHMGYTNDFLGGRGLATRLLWEALKDSPGLDPLSPSNPLIFAPGVVSGFPFSGFGRYAIVSKSALTKPKSSAYDGAATIACAEAGGMFGVMLKKAGFDLMFLTGRCQNLSILYINNDKVELRPAGDLANATTSEFEQKIHARFDSQFDGVHACVSVGPAAQAGVRYSAIVNEVGRVDGSCGMGAVMFSKNLKGIVVYGSKGQLFEEKNFTQLKALWTEAEKTLWNSSATVGFFDYGTAALLTANAGKSQVPFRNHTESWAPDMQKIFPECVSGLWVKRKTACFGCMAACSKIGRVQSGPFKNVICPGPDYEHVMCQANWGIKELNELAAIMADIDELGFDIVGVGGDGSGSFNLSSMAALAAAACGARVAKHGNRAASSLCGSADFFAELGYPLDLPPSASRRLLDDTGFVFLFAPVYHSA
ncbi:MAG: hypothetical protein FWD39_01280, partial [Clostridiales bacterium]|nr:hypothetical protein [Clostridiales bacterium]